MNLSVGATLTLLRPTQASLTITAHTRGRDDGRLRIVAQDDESFWAIVICLAQYHLDVLCRRNALESQIDLLNQEMTMAIFEGQPLSTYPNLSVLIFCSYHHACTTSLVTA